MIILDTNVVSEPTKPTASPVVSEWLDQQAISTLFLTSVSLAELLYGIFIMPDGARKKELSSNLNDFITMWFGSRILPFDRDASVAFASLRGRARAKGMNVTLADGQIAAIAKVQKFTVATRDTAPFIAMGIRVINPWENTKAS